MSDPQDEIVNAMLVPYKVPVVQPVLDTIGTRSEMVERLPV